jgi:hypothetical protein
MAHADDKPESENLELLKFRLERSRYRTDLAKWVIAALGAVASFYVIDLGKLELEKYRATAENQRQLLQAYLTASESPEPEVWKRKLNVLKRVAEDEQIRKWAVDELKNIEESAARITLYRETLKVASQLIEPSQLNEPERAEARRRFDQLYWAELPYVDEDAEVEKAMVNFRNGLVAAEAAPDDKGLWSRMDGLLLILSQRLRDDSSPGSRAGSAKAAPG